MPSATARRIYEDQIPPFMSVFDLDAETIADQETVTLVDPKFVEMDGKTPALMHPSHQHPLRTGPLPMDTTHKHHDSISTQTSESADSSPTTTLSTTDSSPLSDPSPSSSPDSPINLIPLNNFPSTTFSMFPSNPIVNTESLGVAPEPIRLQRPMTSPSPRRARNMKGLSIQPPFAATTSTVSLLSEPASPSFIKPKIPAMKRKPSQLSLKTNTSDLITRTTLEVPPSPGIPPILQRRALKHSTSSPHMLSGLKSSTFGPPSGMGFPKVLERNESGLSEVLRPMKSSMKMTFDTTITEEDSPIKTQMANRSDLEPYGENENNEDLKTPGYPDGPIAIYGDNVYLYMEPTAEEASKFDVVINVAREVVNPFEARQAGPRTPADNSPVPDTAVTDCSFTTAFEYFPDESHVETPTTPKAMTFKTPEYIHIPWDHNTDISPDLVELCETIENRTKQGKKVLVHCQQGASRSASLIIAYGLYQRPDMTVNDAYYAAQAKSRWISPNMKLMYSLQDFQKTISTKRTQGTSSYRPRTGRSPTKHRLTLSANAIDVSPAEPQTAPLPKEDRNKEEDGNSTPNRLRCNSTPGLQLVSPGPASAPLTYTWREKLEQDEKQEEKKEQKEDQKEDQKEMRMPVYAEQSTKSFKLSDLPQRPKSGQGRRFPAPLENSWSQPPPSPGLSTPASFGFQSMGFPRFSDPPQKKKKKQVSYEDEPSVRTITLPSRIYPDNEALLSPRVETMTNNPLHEFPNMGEFPNLGGLRLAEPAPAPSEPLFSPRATMFPRNSFMSFQPSATVSDPRSPPTKGEAPIIRSIDDVL